MATKKHCCEASHNISFAHLRRAMASLSHFMTMQLSRLENNHWQVLLAPEGRCNRLIKCVIVVAQGFDLEIVHMHIV